MYIKQVVIQGFKSFKEQTVLEPFDPRHNVVVGRNGSGKSNFFDAVQFVLSDEYARLRSDQLQNLLHQGTGPRVISAHVEITFDNTERRLPVDKDEVCVRRLFGSKKDQYFLNRKLATRQDVMNLLESAGFSKSNPYYIVKQGKINQMTEASDSQRLKLLLEVAGTRVYDDRCRESKNLLKETRGKLVKIDDMLMNIDERLQILEEEKEELKEYLRQDNERRCLEFTIFERELTENKRKIQNLEQFRAEKKPMQEELAVEALAAQEAIRSAAKAVKEARKEVSVAKEEKDALGAEQQELLKEETKLKLTIKDLREEVSGDKDSRNKAEQELIVLKNDIAAREEELERIKPQYAEIKSIEEDCTQELTLKEQKRQELYAKLDRVSRFRNRFERNEWIQGELELLERQITEKRDHQAKISADLRNDSEKLTSLNNKITAYNHDIELQTASIRDHNERYEEMIKAKDQCQATRKEQYRRESILQGEIDGLKEDLGKVDRSLRSMVGNGVLNGRDSVWKVIETFREREDTANEVTGYHGLMIDNFHCEKTIYKAVEVTAGNRLFNHLTETDWFSTKILKEMNSQHLPGEATFMPFNRINVRVTEYPETNDAIPMISKIDYDPMFDKVFRGPLTGGYFNSARSKMDAQRTRSELISQIGTLEDEMSTLKEEILETENSIVSILTRMQKAEIINSKANDRLEIMKAEIRFATAELATIERYRILKEQSLAQCTSSLEQMIVTKEGFESELSQELTSTLSAEEQQQVDTLSEDIRRMTRENKEAFAKRMGLEAEKNKLENLLTNYLVRRRDELVQALQDISVEDRERKLNSSKVQLHEVKSRLAKVNAEVKAQAEKVLEAVKKQKAQVSEMERRKLSEKQVQDKIEAMARDLEKLASKENIIQKKINEFTQKIAELEALPSHQALDKLAKFSTQQLLKEIEKTNKQLKKYSDVNKRALEQFVAFNDQKENLNKRKEELDIGAVKIQELMFVLEQRKYEAIQFTFKQVSMFFNEVFEKLVPSGHAHLVMLSRNDDEGVAEDPLKESIASERFSGIGIRVSFTGRQTEMREMNQLSGGQKSLVALTLIFAIQKCDPAPFYLFDEIDQALDAEHRRAVADMIHELSSDTQFITTTFRSELLTKANKFYGVKFRNKVSHVECVTLEEAADFVEDDTNQDL